MTTQTAQPGTCNIPNRTIFEGDNLDIMRGINDASVDLIYLDPPFNSNRDYAAPIGSRAAGAAFKDTWDLTDVDEAWRNEIHNILSEFIHTATPPQHGPPRAGDIPKIWLDVTVANTSFQDSIS